MRRSPLILSLLALAVVIPVPRTTTVHAAGVTIEAVTEAVSQAVRATETAVRLRMVPPLDFPMAASPRCDILDNFGDSRGARSHQGTDILATLGQEVYAMADGTLTYQIVNESSNSSLSGNLWELTSADGSGTYYIYAHLSTFASGLQVGSTVSRGQVIGYVGDTGNPGPGNYHLHFEVHPGGGSAVNPLGLITVPASCSVF